MALIGEIQFFERLQFFNGQRLFASDLQALEGLNRDLRWLHNQSLHQPGVGNGYAIVGDKGARKVTINPGYAIDALGREIVLTKRWIEPIPPVADDGNGEPVFYDLTVSYPDDRDLEEAETREGICLPHGVVRLREEPVFCWVRLGTNGQPFDTDLKAQVQNGLKILLARAEVLNCRLNQPLLTAQRRNARPAKQPYVACGKTSPDSTKWQLWDEEGMQFPGLKLVVDTSSARFRTTPCYCAHIVGKRFFSYKADNFLLEGFVNVVAPEPAKFKLCVLLIPLPMVMMGTTLERFSLLYQSLLQENDWHVVWMGVER